MIASFNISGSSFGWSLYAEILSREKGIVCAAASDFTLMQAAMPMSIALAVFGVSNAAQTIAITADNKSFEMFVGVCFSSWKFSGASGT